MFAVLVSSGAAFAQNASEVPAANPQQQQPAAVNAQQAPADKTPPAEEKKVPQTADEAFTTRVKSLEEQISDLKEKILLSKTRLQTLQEKVLGGDLSSGARVVIMHKKELSSAFQMQSITYALDGAPIKTRVDNAGDLDQQEEFEVFEGPIVPGNHQIAVHMVLRGGTRGVFSYAKDYTFTTNASFTFNAEAGKLTQVNVVPYEKGGFTAQLKDRPGFRFETKITRDARRQAAEAQMSGASSQK